ncbi:MAG: hypothetical protein ACI849_001473 [Patiriisocius sp.]|jgi:hypothetical protein
MKKLLPLFVFCISFIAISQDIQRENVTGTIIVEGDDIEGITIFNSSSNTGTVSNENGKFIIEVALNDLIEIRALEYENFDILINKAILESKKLSIFLIEEIYKLEEVIITKTELTGNINTDLNKIKTFSPKLDAIYFGIRAKNASDFSDTSSKQIENLAMQSQGQTMVNGLNVINVVDQLLIPLFRSEVKDKKAAGIPEVPAKSIKYYLGSTFLADNFNIPEHRVEEFIRYVEEEKAFDFDLLNYGHELEFLELLNKKSKTFLDQGSAID